MTTMRPSHSNGNVLVYYCCFRASEYPYVTLTCDVAMTEICKTYVCCKCKEEANNDN